jgi:hypothetical protein
VHDKEIGGNRAAFLLCHLPVHRLDATARQMRDATYISSDHGHGAHHACGHGRDRRL